MDIESRIAQVENNLLKEPEQHKVNPTTTTLAESMVRNHTPGVSVAVIDNGQVEWTRGYGFRASDKLVDTETLFQAASISKPVAALAALLLVEQGKLKLDSDVNEFLTSWKVPPVGDWQPQITLRQLLSHSAGTTVSGFLGYNHTEKVPTLLQILDGLSPANSDPIRVDTLPGVRSRYSGGGTSIVQQMIMDVTGKPFEVAVRELVLEPLEMTRSMYLQPLPAEFHDNAATAHYYTGQAIDGRWFTMPELAAAGLWTTPSDIAKFAMAVQRGYHGKDDLVSQQVARWMLSPPIPANPSHQLDLAYSLGVFMKGDGEECFFGHSGGNVGFRCHFMIYAESGKGAAIMTNADSGMTVVDELERGLAKIYDWPGYLPKISAFDPEPITEHEFAGEYQLDSRLKMTFTLKNGALMLESESQPLLALRQQAKDEFSLYPLNTTIVFKRDDQGKITGFTLKQNGSKLNAEKIVLV